MSVIESYYLENECFLPKNYILNNVGKLTMPVWIVQGRYDFVCRPSIAYKLDKALLDSELIMVIAGHSGNDRAIYDTEKALLLQFK